MQLAPSGQSVEPIAYTIRAAVAASGLSRSRIYELIARGILEARKDGRKTLILAASLNACIVALPAVKPSKARVAKNSPTTEGGN